METLTYQPVLSPIVLTIIFAAALLMLFVGPSFARLTFSRRFTLSMLRLGVIGLALLATLRPGCIKKVETNQAAVFLVLLDISRSMQLPHIADNSTRWGVTRDMIRENRSRFKQLAENNIEVQIFSFDNQIIRLDVDDGVVQLPNTPEGGETDIGTAISQTSNSVRDKLVVALAIVTDGRQNILDPPVEITQSASDLNDMEIPLLAIQMGAPSESEQLADIAITSFPEQLVVNKKNDLNARATMVSRGFANQDIRVELIVTDSEGNEKIEASKTYRPSNSYEETNVELSYSPAVPGEYRIKIRAVPMPEEDAKRNNELEGFLTVRDEGMRVLFINGAPGREQQFLRKSLDPLGFIDMDFRLIYTHAEARNNWPLKEFESDFRDPEKYDVFILCNVDSRAIFDRNRHPQSLEALAEAVRNGKGLLMLGGSHSFGPGLYHQTPLADILPIKMKSTERQDFDRDVRQDLHINSPISVIPTGDSFVTDIGDRSVWKTLPKLAGANRITPKDFAEVLLVSDDDVKRPILVSGHAGGGRVLAFASDSSWRWRFFSKKEYDQFWRQAVLWLAFWDSRNDERVSIVLPKRRFSPKARVKFDVLVKSITGETVGDVEFDAKLILPTGVAHNLSLARSGDRYESDLDPESLARPGLYKIQIAASRNGAFVGNSEREFVVMDRDKEKSNPAANPELMARLASQTSEHGGRALAPEQLSEILDEYIRNPPMTKIEIPTKWRLGETFADATAFLLVFVILLTIEWSLRKKWGLV